MTDKKTMAKIAFILLFAVVICQPAGCAKSLSTRQHQKPPRSGVDNILEQLNRQTAKLKTYQCRIEYLVSQPLFESKALRKGVLYYEKSGGKSALRINFNTLKQDDDEEQKYIEQYIFDGTWLTHINYQSKQVKRYQQAEPNEPVDAFELARENFPIIGFTQADDLKKEFEIKLIVRQESEPARFDRLSLKVKPDSIYKDDYIRVEFWIDRKTHLPAKIVAVSTEDDIYQIELIRAKVNEAIGKKVFDFKIPRGFTMEVMPNN